MGNNPNKRSVKNKILKRLFFALPIVLVIVLAIFTPIHAAHGQNMLSTLFGGLIDIAYYTLGKIAFFISWLIAWICGVFIGIEAWLVAIVLNINSNIFQSAIVQTGFSISLSFANLGFVFGIIIIAIATILQLQTYSIKQILWKLVVMAILVNFGLVIMGVVFNFANQFTNYFLQCIDPTGGGCSGTQTGWTSENDFASNLAGAFNPQVGFLSANNLGSTNITTTNLNQMAGFGTNIGKMLIPIFSIAFLAASLVVIIITFATFITMLLVRYVEIAVLAVLLPFAWMLWVFPGTKKYFNDWWSEFIRWTFFAPIVLFFLWLALMTAHGLSSNTGTQSFATYTSTSSEPMNSMSTLFGNTFTPIIQNILNEIVLVGLMVGGMYAANKMGIKGADTAIGAMKNVGKAVENYSLKQGKKGARAAWQKERNVPFTEVAGLLEEGSSLIICRKAAYRAPPSLAVPLRPPPKGEEKNLLTTAWRKRGEKILCGSPPNCRVPWGKRNSSPICKHWRTATACIWWKMSAEKNLMSSWIITRN